LKGLGTEREGRSGNVGCDWTDEITWLFSSGCQAAYTKETRPRPGSCWEPLYADHAVCWTGPATYIFLSRFFSFLSFLFCIVLILTFSNLNFL
jgi:hypothetical protein